MGSMSLLVSTTDSAVPAKLVPVGVQLQSSVPPAQSELLLASRSNVPSSVPVPFNPDQIPTVTAPYLT